MAVLVVLVPLALIGLWLAVEVVRVFNRLVASRNACSSALSGIDVQLTKRHDLIPNVARAVAGYAAHEKATLAAVTEARSAAVAALRTPASEPAEARLEQAVGALLGLAEAYPALRADDNFLHLQKTLAEIEEQLAAARRAFNAHVLVLNNLVEQFPSSIVAGAMGFGQREFFAAATEERTSPRVTP